ncbi:putative metal-dependent hydrolase [bacterium]|nr:MAG: putative metal-dependent hydrolase [bacterium]
MTDKQFPIGKFTYSGLMSDSERRMAIEQISTLGERLIQLLASYNDSLMDTPYRKGGWTARQVIHHIFDSHANAYCRFKLALTEDNPTIKAYKQDAWAELPDSKLPVEISAKAIAGIHARLGYLLTSLDTSDFEKTINHPENGIMSIDKLTAMYAWHGEHHLEHIRLSLHDDMNELPD